MRNCDRSGNSGGRGAGGAGGSGATIGSGFGVGSITGGVAQAANCSISTTAKLLAALVTEPDSHDVDLGRTQPRPGYIEFIQVIDRPDIDPEVITIVNARPLDARLDTLQGEFSATAVGINVC